LIVAIDVGDVKPQGRRDTRATRHGRQFTIGIAFMASPGDRNAGHKWHPAFPRGSLCRDSPTETTQQVHGEESEGRQAWTEVLAHPRSARRHVRQGFVKQAAAAGIKINEASAYGARFAAKKKGAPCL
jgi:hypothetical protein